MRLGFLFLLHKLEDPISLEDKGLTSYLYFAHSSQDLGIFLLNTSYPFLETTDLLLPKSGVLQGFNNLIDDSALKSNEYFSSLDYITTNTGSRVFQQIKVKSLII